MKSLNQAKFYVVCMERMNEENSVQTLYSYPHVRRQQTTGIRKEFMHVNMARKCDKFTPPFVKALA